MRRFFSIFLSIISVSALFFCSGCAPIEAPSDVLAYQRDAATAAVSGSVGKLEFSAVITLCGCENVNERDFTVEYTAPAALCGIVVSRRGGVYEAKLDTVRTTGKTAMRLSRPAEAFALGGEISQISTKESETLIALSNAEVCLKNSAPTRIRMVCEDGVELILKIEKYIKEG